MYVINDKKRIRSLASNLPATLKGKKLILAVELSTNLKSAQKVGFSDTPQPGDIVLPKAVGPVTRRNAYGRDLIRRDLQKETLYRDHAWTRQEWAGKGQTRTVTSIVSVPYKRYPRNHEAGFEEELVIRKANDKLIVSIIGSVVYEDSNEARLLNAVNIFLEVFGYVELFNEDLEPVPIPSEVKRLNWRILPPGEKISESTLKNVLSRSKRVRPIEMLRQEEISSYGPAERAIGMGGFTGYIVYVFPAKGIAVLESIRYGNASYIIDDGDWERLSKLTKQELLSRKLVKAREVHHGSWTARMNGHLK